MTVTSRAADQYILGRICVVSGRVRVGFGSGRLSTEDIEQALKKAPRPCNPHTTAGPLHGTHHHDTEAGAEVRICVPQGTGALVSSQKQVSG